MHSSTSDFKVLVDYKEWLISMEGAFLRWRCGIFSEETYEQETFKVVE